MITHTMPAFQAVCFSTNSSKEIERGYDISDLQQDPQYLSLCSMFCARYILFSIPPIQIQ